MANIRIIALPAKPTPASSAVVMVDDGSSAGKTTLDQIVQAGRPLANQSEAEAGTNADKTMTPLTTAQAITALGAGLFASTAQGGLADTAVQPGDLSTVATSGDYDDLSGKPTLGTMAAEDASDYAPIARAIPSGGAAFQALGKASGTDYDMQYFSVATLIDEDDMASDSSTQAPTQANVKAYAQPLASNLTSLASAAAGTVANIIEQGAFLAEFTTVSAFLSDTALAYGANPNQAAAGKYIRCRKRGHIYEVADSGASDWHVQTAGGVKCYIVQDAVGCFSGEAAGIASGNSASTNNTILNRLFTTALASGGALVLDVIATIDFSDITASADNVRIYGIDRDRTILRQTVLNAFGLKAQGDDFLMANLTVKANITQLSDYATTGSGIARAMVHCTGDRPVFRGVRIDTPSRCGIFAENIASWKMIDCVGDMGYLLADYNSASTLNGYVIYYDPPANGGVCTMRGCDFKRFMSALGAGNLTGGSGAWTPDIVGNNFAECYDHALYAYNVLGGQIAGNKTYDCRKPFAVGGSDTLIHSNTCDNSGTANSNNVVTWSMRDPIGFRIFNNVLIGVGAGIDLSDFVIDSDVTDNKVFSNTFTSTAMSSELSATLRFRCVVSGTTGILARNEAFDNTITNVSTVASGQAAITFLGNSTGRGANNSARRNKLTLTSTIYGIQAQYCDDFLDDDNLIDRSGYSAGGATTLDFQLYANCSRLKVRDTKYIYESGGTNVTQRGLNIANTCTVIRADGLDWSRVSSGSLAAKTFISNNASAGELKVSRLCVDPATMEGDVTFASGGSVIVNTANVFTINNAAVRVVLMGPLDAGGAGQMASPGIFVNHQPGSTRFLLQTATGSVAASGIWSWRIS